MNKTTISAIASVLGLLLVGAVVFVSAKPKTANTSTAVAATETTDATQEEVTPPTQAAATTSNTTTTAAANTSGYKDGTYSAEGMYQTPQGGEHIGVTLTLASGVVTAASLTQSPLIPESRRYQDLFISAYKQYVIGKSLDSISLSRVSGSSLTSGGFNEAVAKIKVQAKS